MIMRLIIFILPLIFILSCTPEFKFPDTATSTTPAIEPDDPDDNEDGDDDNEPRIPTYGRYQSCLDIHKDNPSFKDGYYYIDHDWELVTDFVNVYCDMTNGGYTEIIGTEGNINLAELKKMCDFTGPEKTLYSDKIKGVGWGQGGIPSGKYCRSCMRCKLFSFMDIKVNVSAKAKHSDAIDRSKGFMWIPNHRYRNGWSVIEFNDRFKRDKSGSNELYVNTVKEINRFPIIDIVDQEVLAPYRSSGDLTVCMGGKRGFYYNKRFIKNLRVR